MNYITHNSKFHVGILWHYNASKYSAPSNIHMNGINQQHS